MRHKIAKKGCISAVGREYPQAEMRQVKWFGLGRVRKIVFIRRKGQETAVSDNITACSDTVPTSLINKVVQ